MEIKNPNEGEYEPHWMYHKEKEGMRYRPLLPQTKEKHDELKAQGYSHEFSPFTHTFTVRIPSEEDFKHYVGMGIYPQPSKQTSVSGSYSIPFNTGRMPTTSALNTFQSVSSGVEH
jgi:hypothetical protein